MSSILTNTSAMVALQTLRGVNSQLATTQSEISTGKSISSARDSASIWAISKVMESDVKGFQGISESLSLGQSTISVARTAAETVTDLLTDMKGLIVSAQEENVDRSKIQTDIEALSDQINSITGAAQFNGLNLVSGTDDVNVLSSLDRSSDGSVRASDITVTRQDLTTTNGVFGAGTGLAGNVTATNGSNSLAGVAGTEFSGAANTMEIAVAAGANNEFYTLQVAGTTVTYAADGTATNDEVAAGLVAALNNAGIEGITAVVDGVTTNQINISSTSKFQDVEVNLDSSAAATFAVNGAAGAGAVTGATINARASEVEFSSGGVGAANTAGVSEGDGYRVTIGGQVFDYVAGKNETFNDVANGLKLAIDAGALPNISTNVTQDATTGNWILQVDNDGADQAFAVTGSDTGTGTATGGLFGMDDIDVTTDDGVGAALSNIEVLIQNSIDAAASFGSDQRRIDTQMEFVTSMMDALKSGIGSLVDANLDEASARFQSLQVQQQLAIQSLAIANQGPQNILALFR
ncbi:MAG: flagellin [Pseudomonadota bacterium]